VHFREATIADREAILALRARCFGDVDREKLDPRFWDWEFGNARIFVGEDGGGIVTHLAFVNDLAVDAMTAPEARGKGAFTGVARYAIEHHHHAAATAYQIRGAVLGSMLRAGWTIADRVPVLLRPAGWGRGKREAFRKLTRDDAQWMGKLARTPEFIAWRFFDNPRWQYDVTGIGDVAYLVARRTQLKGFDTYAIVDLAWRDVRVAKALLRDAVQEARAQRCTLLAALVSRAHPAFGLFLRRGFLPGPHWFRLLVHPPELAMRRRPVMWADTDHL
jgi:GNAT superfamily N-acetyltransferase